MKATEVQNTIVDEANQVTYQVMSGRFVTDGEVYSAIRVALLKRGQKRLTRGETIVIHISK